MHDVLVPDHSLAGSLVLVRQLLAPAPHPLDQADQGLGGGHDVEGRWQRGARLKVADPQLRPRKLPLPGEGGDGDNQLTFWLKTHITGLGIVCAFNRGICVCVRHPHILTIWPEFVEFSKPTISLSAQGMCSSRNL